MINNKTDLVCETCSSPVMVSQDEYGLHYECVYCGESFDKEIELKDIIINDWNV